MLHGRVWHIRVDDLAPTTLDHLLDAASYPLERNNVIAIAATHKQQLVVRRGRTQPGQASRPSPLQADTRSTVQRGFT